MNKDELAYVYGLLHSAINTLKLVKENIEIRKLSEEQRGEFVEYMNELLNHFIVREGEEEEEYHSYKYDSLCEFISEEEEESDKDKIIEHLSKTIVMLTEQAHAK